VTNESKENLPTKVAFVEPVFEQDTAGSIFSVPLDLHHVWSHQRLKPRPLLVGDPRVEHISGIQIHEFYILCDNSSVQKTVP
jgi:hypothetical protein